jgi:hypothetical protein
MEESAKQESGSGTLAVLSNAVIVDRLANLAQLL